ncbi:RNA polymerase sigma factor [Thermohalobacter berrensis]|uniref:RNA polymerase subunit sigma-24 n=1 Tax=Thermohalobacter berrensis TaxID=99594 RepID=A0A419T706_9FIRM|nr:sigma-70 family RNA polymerase sigma factor [Thermohalobacter berrensis]RKD33168.1 RNA polymerase subunit sigma-24 [Thermohalobacter berrensis]
MDNEDRLIAESIKGNIDAFEKLIEKYEKTAYNIALKMLKNHEDAMDISQEALIKVYKSISKFNRKSAFSTWLYRIVVNTCIDFLNKKKKKVFSIDNPITTETGEIKREIEDNTYTPEVIIDRKETKEIIYDSIDKLDTIYKTVIILRDIQGFSYKEIAQILDCSIGTVKSRISRGRKILKKIIVKEMQQNYDY